jgi:hypothetical protein
LSKNESRGGGKRGGEKGETSALRPLNIEAGTAAFQRKSAAPA